MAVVLSARGDPSVSSAGTGAANHVRSAAVAPKGEKPAAEPKIEGMVLNRPNGGFLGLKMVDHRFVLSFYDAKKKPTKVDVARATARWPVHYLPHDERTVLLPNAEGTALTSQYFVRPPYSFKLYLFLFVDDNQNAAESYIFDFHE